MAFLYHVVIKGLTISAINMNSFNVSTLGGDSIKTFKKIEGITAKKSNIILIMDTRMGLKVKEVEKMMQITKNGNFKLYTNSTRESRGVAIAIQKYTFSRSL